MTYLDALQSTLAAEHAALFVMGYLGAQTSESAQPELFEVVTSSYAAHRSLRDELAAQVRASGNDPVAAAAAYDIDDVAGDADLIRQRALELERACSAAYGFLVASSPSTERRFAVEALIETALREVALGGQPRLLPGR